MLLILGDGKKIEATIEDNRILMRADNDGATATLRIRPNAAKTLGEYLLAASIVARD